MKGTGWLEVVAEERCLVRLAVGHEIRTFDVPLENVLRTDGSSWKAEGVPLGSLYDIEVIEDDGFLLVEVGDAAGCEAIQLRLKAIGGASNPGWKLSAPGQSLEPFETAAFLTELVPGITIQEVQSLSASLAGRDSPVTAWLASDGEGHDTVAFEAPGGLAQALSAELERKRAQRQAARAQERQNYWEHVRTAGFVMPYNFVPLPPAGVVDAQRGSAASLALMSDGLLSGSVEFIAKCVTPLLLRGYDDEQGVATPRIDRENHVVVRGSSLKGALRATFEPLTGSCLSIFDTKTRPVYRDPAAPRDSNWRLAVVSKYGRPSGEPEARPLEVQVCSEMAWVPEEDVRSALPETGQVTDRPPTTGERFEHDGGTETTDGHGRRVIAGGTWRHSAGGAWVVLITDTRPRGNHSHWYWAMGKVDESSTLTVAKEAWRDFRITVSGTDDTRTSNAGAAATGSVPAHGRRNDQPHIIGWRAPSLVSTPQVGIPLWVRVQEGEVDRLALSYLWRTHSDAAGPGRRVFPDQLRCTDANYACPACQVFGMIADGGDDAASTRSHIDQFALASVTPLEADLPVTELPAMGAPKPGSGQAYLDLLPGRGTPTLSERPLYEWGSAADRSGGGAPAPIRGRKLYWKSTPLGHGAGRERYSRRTNSRDGGGAMLRAAKLVPEGTEFRGSFHFTNLSPAQLGAVLAVLRPGLLWEDDSAYGWSLGGGKPFGLGTMATESVELTLTCAERYGSLNSDGAAPQDDADQRSYVAKFRESAPRALVEASWPALCNLLAIDHVPGDVIDYPVDAHGAHPRRTPDGYLRLRPGFRFWRQTKGQGGHALTLLPKATDDDLAQAFDGPVISMEHE